MTQRSKFAPLAVLDFKCDHCGQKIDAVVIAGQGVPKKIQKAYHKECWDEHVFRKFQFEKVSK